VASPTLSRTSISPERARGALALHEALKVFCDETGRDTMPLQYLMSFLLVALEEGKGVNEYAERARVSKSVMSRGKCRGNEHKYSQTNKTSTAMTSAGKTPQTEKGLRHGIP
jgi:hypothetical protein